jgi:hypothetical protein
MLPHLLALLLIIGGCMIAVRGTGRDDVCAAAGGHLQGIEMRCTIP